MSVTFNVAETPRVYVERIDVSGNTLTRDKVIRREFRLAEGDPFNSIRVKRSRDRIQSLGFFQENLEIEQTQGSAADRVILSTTLEEKATGQLQVSAGFSSLERFLLNLSIEQRNFRGMAQTLRASINYSSYSKSVELGFTEPYVFDRNIALGFDLFRRDYSSFNFVNNNRNTTYKQVSTGGQLRGGAPLTEYLQLGVRYGLNFDDVTLDESAFFTDPDGVGPLPPFCDPLRVGRYLCEAIGKRTTSSIGYSLLYDTTDNRLRPTRGQRFTVNQDFAGLGGDVKYLRTRANAAKYWRMGGGFIFSTSLEGGYIHSFEDSPGVGQDPVRLTDRFFLGEPQIRGFDIRGVGPRVQRVPFVENDDGVLVPATDRRSIVDDALGGRAYYVGRAELEIPVSSNFRELGLRPSIFVDVGALFSLKDPVPQSILPGDPRTINRCVDPNGGSSTAPENLQCAPGSILVAGVQPFVESYLGDTAKPRLSIGFGVNWNSPFGPFRIDIAKALLKADGDDTKLITFNVGTAF
jgi:outer membrane protein insertion porin family